MSDMKADSWAYDGCYSADYATGYLDAMSTVTEPGEASRQAAARMQADHEAHLANAYMFIGGLLAGLAITLIIWALTTR